MASHKNTSRDRAGLPTTLAEQLVAWLAYRNGDSTSHIASRLQRSPSETRAILWGTNE